MYLLCDLTVDKNGPLAVDVTWIFFVDTVPGNVIGVIEVSGFDSLGSNTVELFIVFLVEKSEGIVIDVDRTIMVEVLWNIVVNEYGCLVASMVELLGTDVVGDLIVDKNKDFAVIVDRNFVVKTGPGIVIVTVETSCFVLVGSISDVSFEIFTVDADETVVSDVNGAFIVDVVWNIASDEYEGCVVSVTGVFVLYLLSDLAVDENRPIAVDVAWIFFVEKVSVIIIGVFEAFCLDSVESIAVDSFKVFVVEKTERIVIDADGAIMVKVLSNTVVIGYGNLVVRLAELLGLNVVGVLIVNGNKVLAVAVGRMFVVEAGPGTVTCADEDSCLDLVESITDDFFEVSIVDVDEVIVTDVNGPFTVDESRDFVVSIPGVSVLYLLCGLAIDENKAFSVDVIWIVLVDTVPGIVIGVVEVSGFDSVGSNTVDLFIVFVLEENERTFLDIDGTIMVEVPRNILVNEYGYLVVTLTRLLIAGVVGDFIVDKNKDIVVAIDGNFVVKTCPGIVTGTVENLYLALVGNICAVFLETFIVDTDESVDSDVNGTFMVDVIWNIASDEYRGSVVGIAGAFVLYFLCCFTVDENGPFGVDVIRTFFVEVVPDIVIGVFEASGLDSVESITVDMFIAFAVEKSEPLFTDVNLVVMVGELWNIEYGSFVVTLAGISLLNVAGGLIDDKNEAFGVNIDWIFSAEATLGIFTGVIESSGLVVGESIFVDFVKIFVLDKGEWIASDASEVLNVVLILNVFVNEYWAPVAISNDRSDL